MIEILREPDLIRIAPLGQMLEAAGIRTFIRNEHVSVTEPTLPVFSPALCILDEGDHQRALELIKEFEKAPPGNPDELVKCPACGEESPGNFTQCWSCNGELGPAGAPPLP